VDRISHLVAVESPCFAEMSVNKCAQGIDWGYYLNPESLPDVSPGSFSRTLREVKVMKLSSKLAVLFIVLLCGVCVSAQRRSSDAGNSAQSQARAYEVIEAGMKALGGLEAIRETQDVSVKVSGFSYARNQSLGVNPPYDKMTREENLYIDLRNRKYIIETRDPLPGGFVFGGKQVINGNQGFFVNPRDKTITPLNLTNFNNIGIVRRLPHLLLLVAYENAPSTLRWRGQESFEGHPQNVISFASSNGILWTLFFDRRTNLLTKYEQMVSDNVRGDSVQETIFPSYHFGDKLRFPTGRVTKRAGEVIEEVSYGEVRFNTRLGDSAFAKPEGFDDLPAPTPAPIKETKLADGVFLFESGTNSLVVEFDDHLMVVEPSAGGRGPKPTILKAREMFPGKPIKYVVVTHHHDDHSGGLRSYIAEDIAVVTTQANKTYFETMAAANFTINRDDQTKNKRKPVFEFVRGKKRVFTDGKRTVEIIDIGPSPHANEMLVAYLPNEKVVFQGDLVNLPASGKYMPTTVIETTIHFFDSIKRLGLDVERIAAVHGPLTTQDELRKAIEKSRSSR
jgi:glyoxylase-like metal-dependent hydrolase (beta-lactamase superfamily II)